MLAVPSVQTIAPAGREPRYRVGVHPACWPVHVPIWLLVMLSVPSPPMAPRNNEASSPSMSGSANPSARSIWTLVRFNVPFASNAETCAGVPPMVKKLMIWPKLEFDQVRVAVPGWRSPAPRIFAIVPSPLALRLSTVTSRRSLTRANPTPCCKTTAGGWGLYMSPGGLSLSISLPVSLIHCGLPTSVAPLPLMTTESVNSAR